VDVSGRGATQLSEAGFIGVEDVLKIPSGSLAGYARLRKVGAIERLMVTDGLEAHMILGWIQAVGSK